MKPKQTKIMYFSLFEELELYLLLISVFFNTINKQKFDLKKEQKSGDTSWWQQYGHPK